MSNTPNVYQATDKQRLGDLKNKRTGKNGAYVAGPKGVIYMGRNKLQAFIKGL